MLEVVAKVEAAKMEASDGTQYTIQGRLWVEHDDMSTGNEPQLMAVVLPEDLWRSMQLGDVVSFPMAASSSGVIASP